MSLLDAIRSQEPAPSVVEVMLGKAAYLAYRVALDGESARENAIREWAGTAPESRVPWIAAAHEALMLAHTLRSEATEAARERRRPAVEPGDGIVDDDYTGKEGA